MSKKAALYARVSTENQELDRQQNKLESWAENQEDLEYDLYSEKVSSIKDRPEFEKIMESIEEYDLVVVTKIDRFARSIQDFLQRINRVRENGAEFKALDQPINTQDEIYGDFLLKQLALFADLERKMIRRRLEEGYKEAKKEGRVGRPNKLTDEEKQWVAEEYQKGASYNYIRLRLNDEKGKDVSQSTIGRVLRERGLTG